MKEIKTLWKRGTRFSVDAETAWEVIEENRKAHGGDVDVEALFLSQADEDAPLHSEFVWDADVALLELGKQTARKMVSSIEFVYADQEDAQPVRYYESVRVQYEDDPKPRPVYRRTEDILANPDQRAQLLSAAIRDANAFRRRYSGLVELSKVIDAFDDFLDGAETG